MLSARGRECDTSPDTVPHGRGGRDVVSRHTTRRRRCHRPEKVLRLAPDLGDGRIVEEVEEPVGGDPGPALRALQLVEVGHAPEQGRYLPAELDAHDLVDGELAAQLHELPERLVAEGLGLLAVYSGKDVFGDGFALLHGGLGIRGHRLAVRVHRGRAVADPPHVVVADDPHKAVDRKTSAFIVREGEVVELPARAGAGGPDHVLGRDLAAIGEDNLVGLHLPGLGVVYDLYPEVVEPHVCHPAESGVQLLQDLLVSIDEDYLRAIRIYVGIVGNEEFLKEVMQFGGNLDPGRATPDDDEGELGVGHVAPGKRRLFVAIDDAVADLLTSPYPLYADGVLFDAGDPKVGRLRPEGEDQVVVRKLLARGRDYLPLGIHALEIRPPKAGAEPDERPAQRLRYVVRLDVAPDHARQHGPEGDVVLPGDEHDAHVVALSGQPAELRDRVVAGESPTHDEHLVGEVLVGRPLPRLVSPPRPGEKRPPQYLDADRPATDGERPFEQTFHLTLPTLEYPQTINPDIPSPPKLNAGKTAATDASIARVIADARNDAFQTLQDRLATISDVSAAAAVLTWD